MKKFLLTIILFLTVISFGPSKAFAQGMMNWGNNTGVTPSAVSSTAQDEQKGKQIWEKLQTKQISCDKLKDDDYELLGEYFMGQSIGNTERHAVMNQMMQNMMGQSDEEQAHIALGKRSSGCDTNASFPSGYGMLLMWWMMGGGGNPMMGYGGWGGFGFGWIFMIVFWILIILGVVALVRYLGNSGKTTKDDKTPLEILKERYAKGEIDKKEFEQMKKDLA